MTFKAIFVILTLAHRQRIFLAPLLFLWVVLIHHIFEVTVQPITLLLFGIIIATSQQFSMHVEDTNDGFRDHCLYNGAHPIFYIFAKFACELIITLLPMLIILCLETPPFLAILILFQWGILHISLTSILMINILNPLKMLIGILPISITPFILFMNFLNTKNENSLLILLGYDIILCSVMCIIHTSQKYLVKSNVSFSS